MQILQIGHEKGQGKDTFAFLLKEFAERKGLKVEIVSFATPLKEIMSEALGIPLDILDDLKNNNDYYRGILQRFGSGKMKELFGSDVWVKLFEEKLEGFFMDGVELVIVPDFRFKVEFIGNAKTYNVTGHVKNEGDTSSHISETELDDFPYDVVVYNTGSIRDLAKIASKEIELLFGEDS